MCSACKKRPYCSRDCQIDDWKSNNRGQAHKLWCSIPCCEQNIEYEIRYISPERGMGVVAKVPIYRGTYDGGGGGDARYTHTGRAINT